MADKEKKDDDKGRKDADDTVTDDGDDGDDDDDDDDGEEAGWTRLSEIVDSAVEKRLKEWQSKEKTISSRSRRKVAQKPQRKQGFLSTQFFSNLNPKSDEE